MKIYRDKNDWWIGYYRGDSHHYVCLLPTLVIRWDRKDDFEDCKYADEAEQRAREAASRDFWDSKVDD